MKKNIENLSDYLQKRVFLRSDDNDNTKISFSKKPAIDSKNLLDFDGNTSSASTAREDDFSRFVAASYLETQGISFDKNIREHRQLSLEIAQRTDGAVSKFLDNQVDIAAEKMSSEFRQKKNLASVLTSGDENSSAYKAVLTALNQQDEIPKIEGVEYQGNEEFAIKEGYDFREIRRDFLKNTGNEDLQRQIQNESKGRSYEGPSLG